MRAGPRLRAELVALAKLPDEAIDTQDIPELTNWGRAEIGRFYRPRKQIVTMRLDADIVSWFKARSPKYQTAVNQVLRDYVASGGRRSAARPTSVKARRRKTARG